MIWSPIVPAKRVWSNYVTKTKQFIYATCVNLNYYYFRSMFYSFGTLETWQNFAITICGKFIALFNYVWKQISFEKSTHKKWLPSKIKNLNFYFWAFFNLIIDANIKVPKPSNSNWLRQRTLFKLYFSLRVRIHLYKHKQNVKSWRRRW